MIVGRQVAKSAGVIHRRDLNQDTIKFKVMIARENGLFRDNSIDNE